jgi:hypothetical protein
MTGQWRRGPDRKNVKLVVGEALFFILPNSLTLRRLGPQARVRAIRPPSTFGFNSVIPERARATATGRHEATAGDVDNVSFRAGSYPSPGVRFPAEAEIQPETLPPDEMTRQGRYAMIPLEQLARKGARLGANRKGQSVMTSYKRSLAIAAALAAAIGLAQTPARASLSMNSLSTNSLSMNALTQNALIQNALTQNALDASGSPLGELNGVTVEAVTPDAHGAIEGGASH